MKRILLFAEHDKGQLQDSVLLAAGLAREIADKARCELAALLLGPGAEPLVNTLGEHGVDRVLICKDPALAGYAPEVAVHVAVSVIKRHEPLTVVFAESTTGSDLATRIAARLQSGFAAHCTGITAGPNGELKSTRLGYSGKLQTITIAPQIIVLEQGVGEGRQVRRVPQVEEIEFHVPPGTIRLDYVKTEKADPNTIPLTQAEFIVSGGNGVQNFGLLSELANEMKATVGGSRVVCDDGRLPRERQIGESGTTVKPRCYIAFGISGASQHVRGMQESKLIIAVNTDRHAPLMKMANMAVVADAEAVMNAMLRLLISK